MVDKLRRGCLHLAIQLILHDWNFFMVMNIIAYCQVKNQALKIVAKLYHVNEIVKSKKGAHNLLVILHDDMDSWANAFVHQFWDPWQFWKSVAS